MQSALRFKLMAPGSLRSGIVVFLLAFAFFDLAIVDVFFPQLCGDGQSTRSLTSPIKFDGEPYDEFANSELLGRLLADPPSLTILDSHPSPIPGNDSQQSPIDEDCFCCCSHIIPTPNVNVAASNDPPKLDDQTITSLPLAAPNGAFHPPRFYV